MVSILQSVDQRTRLAGENKLELLLFRLQQGKLFATNVFKIQEVQAAPHLTLMPQRHRCVAGITRVRDKTIPVIDLGAAIGMRPVTDFSQCKMMVAEYNNTVQGFLIGSVDRIINLNWDTIKPPPGGAGRAHYLTAITLYQEEIVEILDLEKVLQDIAPVTSFIDQGLLDPDIHQLAAGVQILAVDDSHVGLSQVTETVKQLGVDIITASNGEQALDMLKGWAREGIDLKKKLAMVITDAEMPKMDGYRLTVECRSDPQLKDLYIVLHTSLSGSFNEAMVKKVGCDAFLSKFEPGRLASVVQERVRAYRQHYPL